MSTLRNGIYIILFILVSLFLKGSQQNISKYKSDELLRTVSICHQDLKQETGSFYFKQKNSFVILSKRKGKPRGTEVPAIRITEMDFSPYCQFNSHTVNFTETFRLKPQYYVPLKRGPPIA